MNVTGLEFVDGALKVTCSGKYGEGSKGQPSAEQVRSSIERWIEGHPDQSVTRIDVDYTDVDYSWGDGPVSSLVQFYKRGVSKMRIIASRKNLDSLEGLVTSCNIPFIEVVEERRP